MRTNPAPLGLSGARSQSTLPVSGDPRTRYYDGLLLPPLLPSLNFLFRDSEGGPEAIQGSRAGSRDIRELPRPLLALLPGWLTSGIKHSEKTGKKRGGGWSTR